MSDRSVLVLGEALVDIVESDDGETVIPGGSAANVALGLARRAIDVTLATCLAHDRHGDLIATHLADNGVRFAPDSFQAPRTSSALAHRLPSGDVSYTFDVEWRPQRLAVSGDVDWLHLGAFPAFSERETDLIAHLADLRDRLRISFDPNIRSALIGDPAAARQRFRQLCAVADVLKLSDEDAAYLAPGQSLRSVLEYAVSAGVALAVGTAGADGLLMMTSRGCLRVPAPRVPVVDTIGAGDTVMASLIADGMHGVGGRLAVLDETDLAGLGTRAVSAAAITVGRAGADLPFSHELSSS